MNNKGRFGLLLLSFLLILNGCRKFDYGQALLGAFYPAWNEIFDEYCHGEKPKYGCGYFVHEKQDTLPHDIFKFRFYKDDYSFERKGEIKTVKGWCFVAPIEDLKGDDLSDTCYDQNGNNIIDGLTAKFENDLVKVYRELGAAFAQKNKLPVHIGIRLARKLEAFAQSTESRDLFEFTKDFYGVKLAKLAEVVEESVKNPNAVDEVCEDIANHWESDPKIVRPILVRWIEAAKKKIGSAELIDGLTGDLGK